MWPWCQIYPKISQQSNQSNWINVFYSFSFPKARMELSSRLSFTFKVFNQMRTGSFDLKESRSCHGGRQFHYCHSVHYIHDVISHFICFWKWWDICVSLKFNFKKLKLVLLSQAASLRFMDSYVISKVKKIAWLSKITIIISLTKYNFPKQIYSFFFLFQWCIGLLEVEAFSVSEISENS